MIARQEGAMAVLLVSYDLRKEVGTQGYQKLWDELERLNCHKIQDSVWLAYFRNSAREIHDHLKAFVDSNDRLLVCEFTDNHWFSNAMGDTNQWLKKNRPAR